MTDVIVCSTKSSLGYTQSILQLGDIFWSTKTELFIFLIKKNGIAYFVEQTPVDRLLEYVTAPSQVLQHWKIQIIVLYNDIC